MGRWFQPSAHFIALSLAAFVAVGFNPQVQKIIAQPQQQRKIPS